tara:strand:+ start:2865 stop:3782 length:918 start_codon:yes stop_codon:yes gene_type:complete
LSIIGIVAHDAGGSEVLSHWVSQNIDQANFKYLLDGPAINIFKKNLKREFFLNQKNIEPFIEECDSFICATSWKSDLEKKIIKEAAKKKKRVASVLDHWINYRERFLLNGDIYLPNEIWVCDKYALDIASRSFPDMKLKLIKNPYLESLKKRIKSVKRKSNKIKNRRVLYVCEPIAEHSQIQYGDQNFLGYDENSAIRYFFENINLLNIDFDKILIRPHPSESVDKYKWVKGEFRNFDISIEAESELLEEIVNSEIVVGCESMAMVVALEVNKRVFTSIPPNGRECVLPHKSIKSMSKEISDYGV